MDDLIAFCVEQITFDGDQGTKLEHLWGFVKEFLSKNEDALADIDDTFKRRLWRYMLGQKDLILKEGEAQLFPSDIKSEETDQTATIRDLDKVLSTYNAEDLRLFTSEETQWKSITGFPKQGNPVPNFHFKLLCAVSQARAAGISQAQASKITKQDPRSFPGRTKLLAELGLLTKTPCLDNGNHTYRLTHTRFLPPQTPPLPPTVPPTIESSNKPENNVSTTNETAKPVSEYRGFYRDQTIASQVTELVGQGPWEKKNLMTQLMASSYEEPIENFLEKVIEKGILPKPIPVQRPYTVPNFVKVGRKSRSTKPKPPAPPTEVDPDAPPEVQTPGSQAPGSQAPGSQAPAVDGEVKRAMPRKRKAPKEKLSTTTTTTTTTTTATATEGLLTSPKPKKRRKVAVPTAPIPLLDEQTIQLISQEREKHLLSMLQSNAGVIEIDLKLDTQYNSYIRENFPDSPDSPLETDYKTLIATLDALNAKGEVDRLILTASTFTGRKLYKSVLTLPGVDLETNERIGELREILRQEALGYKATPMELIPADGDIGEMGEMGDKRGEVRELEVEIVKSAPRQRDLAPIPLAIPPSEETTKRKRKAPPKKPRPKKIPVPPSNDKDGSHEPADEESGSSKRRRLGYTPSEDILIYQSVSLTKKYVPARHTAWTLVTPFFPGRKADSIKRRYEILEEMHRDTISRFLAVFEKEYSAAEQRGEVKPLELGLKFDLGYCLDWWGRSGLQSVVESERGIVVLQESEDMLLLPERVEDLRRWFEVEEVVGEGKGSWQGDFWGKDSGSAWRRQDRLYSEAFMVPLMPPESPTVDETAEFLESLVKATVLTPDAMHDKEKTKQVLESRGVREIEFTVRSLVDRKLISRVDHQNRPIPGRHYKMAEKWTHALRGLVNDNLFEQGQAFREYLGKAFHDGKEVLISEMTNDGSVYCILNLLASGEIMLKSTVKEFKMGNLTNTYMGRSFDKRKLEFGVIVAATEKFDYNGKIAPSKREPSRMSGEPQAWVSVNDEILDGPLRLLKCFVYSQIHFRPSLTEDELFKLCGGILTTRECRAIVKSLEDDGLIRSSVLFAQTPGFMTIP